MEAYVAAKSTERASFARALKVRLGGMSRREFGAAVAKLSGETVTEAAVSLWLLGRSEPSRRKVFAIEKVLGCSSGQLSRHLGYLPVSEQPSPDVRAALEADPALSRGSVEMLLAAYEAARLVTAAR